MSGVKHTPGPWCVQKNGITVMPAKKPRFPLTICQAREVYGDRAQREANAHLIAAAPNLLEACEQALQLHEPDEGISDVLLAAIAKAKGEPA